MSSDRVRNICFHGVGEPQRELEPGEDVYWVKTDQFEAILDEVASWTVPVRLSFDDGNASDVEIGLPALVERNLSGEFFLLAGRLDTPGSVDSPGVKALRSAGMRIGSHGMDHRSWRGLDDKQREAEFNTARAVLARAADGPVDTAACPLGRYDRRVLTELRGRGYTRVYTSDRRPARAGSWLQPRYSVRRHDTPESLRAEVLAPAPLPARARALAVGTVKRWR